MITDVGAVSQLDVIQAPEQLLQGYPQVQPSQIRAGAAVRPGAEAEMPVPLASEIESVRVTELSVVPVSRAPVDEDLVALLDRATAELGVTHCRPADRDERRVEPQQLLDPAYAANAFLTALQRYQQADPGWATQPLWATAQAVQASGFPTAYAQWESQAAGMVKAIATGLV